MQGIPTALILFILFSCAGQQTLPNGEAAETPYALVDVFIGTGGHGHTHPSAMRPFGMIQAGPDTRKTGWDGCSGYHYDDDTLHGFSQTHLSGTGVSDYGDVLLLPIPVSLASQTQTGNPSATFRHTNEEARPGWYAVTLDNGTQVQIDAADRSALYAFSHPTEELALWIDLDYRDAVWDVSLQQDGPSSISGHRISDAWAKGQHACFALEANRNIASLERDGNKALVRFAEAAQTRGENDTLLVKIALSAVDINGARRNLAAEIPAFDRRALARETKAIWTEALSRVTVSGGTPAERRSFYTAHYHTLCAPNLFSDVDGRYRGMDHAVHPLPERSGDGANMPAAYTVFSLWDTYRAAHPFYTLCWPEYNRAFIATMLDDFDRSGRLPVWKLSDWETDCMIGYHSIPVLVDAWRKDQTVLDPVRALQAMLASAELDQKGLNAYRTYGYIPSDIEAESVSKTLEYAYDDACIAAMAADLARQHERGLRTESGLPDGRSFNSLADTYTQRAAAWKHLLDPASGFFRARRNGGFVEPFDPAEVNFHYTEANAWQYAFSAPQDIRGHAVFLAAARQGVTGRKADGSWSGDAGVYEPVLAAQLDALFAASSETTGREQADITGLIGQYAHGNEPSHHLAYLYAQLGQPWKTQAMVRRILAEMYSDQPDGLCGNEDCGQMSAWYLLSAAGFYPVAPGSPVYTLGSPLFDTILFQPPRGQPFRIIARNNSPGNVYIAKAELNGQPYDSVTLHHRTIQRGGTLVLEMTDVPVREWGVSDAGGTALCDASRPLAAPYADPAPMTFTDSLTVALRCADDRVQLMERILANPLQDADPRAFAGIQWRYSGEQAWRTYTKPFHLTENAAIEFRSVAGANPAAPALSSPVQKARFVRTQPIASLELAHPYAPQYAAGGAMALLDQYRGDNDFRTGLWQGFQGTDLLATLDFGAVRPMRSVRVGFLQDPNAWIFYPLRLEVEWSADGSSWHTAGAAEAPLAWSVDGARHTDFVVSLNAKARYLRLRGVNRGQCPPEHKGAGHPAWIFADEILVD